MTGRIWAEKVSQRRKYSWNSNEIFFFSFCGRVEWFPAWYYSLLVSPLVLVLPLLRPWLGYYFSLFPVCSTGSMVDYLKLQSFPSETVATVLIQYYRKSSYFKYAWFGSAWISMDKFEV